jgi:hypothetical protein
LNDKGRQVLAALVVFRYPTLLNTPVTQFTLLPLLPHFAICKLSPGEKVPDWAATGPFASITRTAEELSVVCLQESVPDGVRHDSGWRCLRVAGTFDFAMVGLLASLLQPLAEAGIAVFAVSTFDTDYLLVKQHQFDGAAAALRRAGHTVLDP